MEYLPGDFFPDVTLRSTRGDVLSLSQCACRQLSVVALFVPSGVRRSRHVLRALCDASTALREKGSCAVVVSAESTESAVRGLCECDAHDAHDIHNAHNAYNKHDKHDKHDANNQNNAPSIQDKQDKNDTHEQNIAPSTQDKQDPKDALEQNNVHGMGAESESHEARDTSIERAAVVLSDADCAVTRLCCGYMDMGHSQRAQRAQRALARFVPPIAYAYVLDSKLSVCAALRCAAWRVRASERLMRKVLSVVQTVCIYARASLTVDPLVLFGKRADVDIHAKSEYEMQQEEEMKRKEKEKKQQEKKAKKEEKEQEKKEKKEKKEQQKEQRQQEKKEKEGKKQQEKEEKKKKKEKKEQKEKDKKKQKQSNNDDVDAGIHEQQGVLGNESVQAVVVEDANKKVSSSKAQGESREQEPCNVSQQGVDVGAAGAAIVSADIHHCPPSLSLSSDSFSDNSDDDDNDNNGNDDNGNDSDNDYNAESASSKRTGVRRVLHSFRKTFSKLDARLHHRSPSPASCLVDTPRETDTPCNTQFVPPHDHREACAVEKQRAEQNEQNAVHERENGQKDGQKDEYPNVFEHEHEEEDDDGDRKRNKQEEGEKGEKEEEGELEEEEEKRNGYDVSRVILSSEGVQNNANVSAREIESEKHAASSVPPAPPAPSLTLITRPSTRLLALAAQRSTQTQRHTSHDAQCGSDVQEERGESWAR